MNSLTHYFIRSITATALALPLTACATLFGEAIEGTVFEEGTNKPIAGAIVIVRWAGVIPTLGHASSACVHVESATTDAAGRYRTPAWRAPSTVGPAPLVQMNIGPGAYAHKPGYAYVDTQGETVYLKPFAGGRGERLEYLLRVSRTTGCHAAGVSEKNLLPLRKALYEEARQIAQTREEKKILEDLLYSMEVAELGYETAQKRHLERLGARK